MRQYVGARYVPKFAEPYEWNINNTYEPLTIVGYLSNSYTSKKRVPAGVQISNEEYWVLTGNLNGAVNELRKEVMELSGDVASAEADITALRNQLNDIPFTGKTPVGMKKCLIVTDSFGIVNGGFQNELRQMWRLDQDDMLISAQGSAGFYHQGTSGMNWVEQVTAWFNSANETTKKDITHIFFIGGANDVGESRNLVSDNIRAAIDICRKNCLTANIYIGFVARTMNPERMHLFYNMSAVYKNATYTRNGVSYMNGCECALYEKKFISADGVHPTVEGYVFLARGINEYIRTGKCSITTELHEINVSSNFNARLYEYIYDNVYVLQTNQDGLATAPASTGHFNVIANGNGLSVLDNVASLYATGNYFRWLKQAQWIGEGVWTETPMSNARWTQICFYDNNLEILLTTGQRLFNGKEIAELRIPAFRLESPLNLV